MELKKSPVSSEFQPPLALQELTRNQPECIFNHGSSIMIRIIALGILTIVNIIVMATKMLTTFFSFDLAAKDIFLILFNFDTKIFSSPISSKTLIESNPSPESSVFLLLGGNETELRFL